MLRGTGQAEKRDAAPFCLGQSIERYDGVVDHDQIAAARPYFGHSFELARILDEFRIYVIVCIYLSYFSSEESRLCFLIYGSYAFWA
jgi:hypothetical protein